MRYNSSSSAMEYCDGSNWRTIGGVGTLTTRTGMPCSVNGASCTSTANCLSSAKAISGGCTFTGNPVVSSASRKVANGWSCTANCSGWATNCGASSQVVCEQ